MFRKWRVERSSSLCCFIAYFTYTFAYSLWYLWCFLLFPLVVDLCSFWNVFLFFFISFVVAQAVRNLMGTWKVTMLLIWGQWLQKRPVNSGNLSVKFFLKYGAQDVVLLVHLLLKSPQVLELVLKVIRFYLLLCHYVILLVIEIFIARYV